MRSATRLAALAVLCASPCVHAETLYVIEQLFVTVNSAPDGTGDRVGQIKSGDPVELIERQDGEAHVRLASGEEGWVKATYLSADPPLRQQLAARSDELEKIRKEKAQLEAELASARSAAAAATATAQKLAAKAGVETKRDTAPPARAAESNPVSTSGGQAGAALNNGTANPGGTADASAAPAGDAPSASPPLFQDEPLIPSRPSWWVTLVAILLALASGFAIGWRMLDRRIRAKYGGLRIY